MGNQMISVILPTYNRAGLLNRSIQSVLNQTYQDFELIIVDDGSKDNTRELVKGIKDKRIRYLYCEKNGGASKARNIGIEHAKYDYIAFLDSDDEWLQDKLRIQFELLNQAPPDTGFIYCRYRYYSFDPGIRGILPLDASPGYEKAEYVFARLLCGNVVATPCLLIKKECFRQQGYFDESLPCLEDYEFILRVSQKYAAAFVDEVLVNVYATADCVSGNKAGDLAVSSLLIGIYKKELIKYDLFNSVIEEHLEKAKAWGFLEQVVPALEKLLSM